MSKDIRDKRRLGSHRPSRYHFNIPIIDCARAHGHQQSTLVLPPPLGKAGAAGWRLGASHSVQLSASPHGSKTRSITIAQARLEEARRDGLGSRLQRRHETNIAQLLSDQCQCVASEARCLDLALLADVNRASDSRTRTGKSPASGMRCV